MIVLQTLPAIVFGLCTAWFHRHALLAGWAAGMGAGMGAGIPMLYHTSNAATGKEHWAGSLFKLSKLGLDTDKTLYTGILALVVNIAVCVAGTWLARVLGTPTDETEPADYFAEAQRATVG